MSRPASKQPEVALPIAALHALRTKLIAEVGDEAAASALRAAGHAAGDAVHATLLASLGARVAADPQRQLAELDTAAFWRRVGEFFAARGWGRLRLLEIHEGVGALESGDWAESNHAGAQRPSCHLTTGVLANLVGRIAGRPIAVLEAECRGCGDARCVFLFGSPEALDVLHADLAAGADLSRAIAELV